MPDASDTTSIEHRTLYHKNPRVATLFGELRKATQGLRKEKMGEWSTT